MNTNDKLVLAIPKGRILNAITPLMLRAGVELKDRLSEKYARQLQFATTDPNVEIVLVSSFDVVTFLAFGAAHLAIAGSDVLMEFNHPEVYTPVNLDVSICHLAVAAPAKQCSKKDSYRSSYMRVATKYPNLARNYFAQYGIQAECIKLNGALEMAPNLGLCCRIVDLVQTGSTLKANGLVEIAKIADVSARLAVNRTALKIRPRLVSELIERFRGAVSAT
ncbi:ATP phosphoribosyltransferase [Candidatus Endolissoclinum faulkneri L5]|uniref:ATP phosphoribosyltransferase n=1 Tax=Candidatus Endolissoclinum faulkneri L5 TaxID=1401328 RepID=V9TUR2_9PROT|nr:ATP phosphoribosyltransferase [Candidatus Endolissoclinum faulkneri]AHC73428.1 ATP phosphoribosyltransferase [Candidatus Endolissoclinum faulkneri L5]